MSGRRRAPGRTAAVIAAGQVTIGNDLDVWLAGLRGRSGVTVAQFPDADHLFLDGSGPPTPLDYQKPGRVDPAVIASIAGWVDRIDAAAS